MRAFSFPRLSEYLPIGRRFDKQMREFLGHLLGLFCGEITIGCQSVVKHLYHLDALLRLKMKQYILAEYDAEVFADGPKRTEVMPLIGNPVP